MLTSTHSKSNFMHKAASGKLLYHTSVIKAHDYKLLVFIETCSVGSTLDLFVFKVGAPPKASALAAGLAQSVVRGAAAAWQGALASRCSPEVLASRASTDQHPRSDSPNAAETVPIAEG